MTANVHTPAIIHVLEVVAWVTIAIALLCAAWGAVAVEQTALIGGGISCTFMGLILLALCFGLRKLNEIEHHLRK